MEERGWGLFFGFWGVFVSLTIWGILIASIMGDGLPVYGKNPTVNVQWDLLFGMFMLGAVSIIATIYSFRNKVWAHVILGLLLLFLIISWLVFLAPFR